MPPSHRRYWLLLWIALATMLVVRATGRRDDRGVIRDSLEFGRRLTHGEFVYAPWRSGLDAPERPLHAPYPPSFGLLMAPFAVVQELAGLRAARAAWALLQVGALVAIAWSLRRLPTGRAPPDERTWPWLWLGTLVLAARFVLRDTHGGGGNLVNVAFALLAWTAAERGNAARAGWWLGLSLVTKPTQALLLPVLWLLGHRRAALHTTLAAAVLALASLALSRFDPEAWLRWLRGSWAFATQADAWAVPAYGFPEFEWMNQSLRCAAARWFGAVPAEFAARVQLGVLPGLGLAAETVGWIVRAVSLGAIAALLAVAARARSATDARRTFAIGGAMALSLLLSPLSWKAHHVALLPLLFLLVQRAVERRTRGAIGLLVAFAATCSLGGDVLGDDLDELGNSLYLVTAIDALLLAAALRFALEQPRPSD